MDPDAIRAAVHDLFKKGDETIIDYVCGILEDEHFEFGDDGEGAFESIGPFLVRGRMGRMPVMAAWALLIWAVWRLLSLHGRLHKGHFIALLASILCAD